MKTTKFCKQKCYFLTFFCPADDPVVHQLILLCAKGTKAVPDKQKTPVKELVVVNSTNN